MVLHVYLQCCSCAVEGQFLNKSYSQLFTFDHWALSVHTASCRETCWPRTVVFKLISLMQAVSRFTMMESSVICYCTSTAFGLIKPIYLFFLHTYLCRHKSSQSNLWLTKLPSALCKINNFPCLDRVTFSDHGKHDYSCSLEEFNVLCRCSWTSTTQAPPPPPPPNTKNMSDYDEWKQTFLHKNNYIMKIVKTCHFFYFWQTKTCVKKGVISLTSRFQLHLITFLRIEMHRKICLCPFPFFTSFWLFFSQIYKFISFL